VTILRKKFSPPARPYLPSFVRMRRRPFGSLFREVQTFDLPRRWVRTRARHSFNTSPNGNWRARLAHLVIVHCYFPSSHWYACAKPARGLQAARCFGVHWCAAAGKDANVSARPKVAERPVPARRFNLAMEILILESPLRFVLYPLGPWKSQPTYTAGSAVCQQLCILKQSFDAPCSIVATPLLATLARPSASRRRGGAFSRLYPAVPRLGPDRGARLGA
jgi:hypothetical protein